MTVLRVLCVDDSADDAELNALALQRHGFELVTKRVDRRDDAQAALAQEWDLILCDYSMPAFSAIAMLELIKELGADVPCLIVSGAVGEEAAVETIRRGADVDVFTNII